jgi:tetratricopeptide (TPR) repeat protein
VTTPLERREWWVVETPHFEITSLLGQPASVRLARDLEYFVLACEAILGTPLTGPSVRTRVYALDGKGLERPFAVANQPSYFLPSLEGGILVLRRGSGFDDATESVRFELARYLAHNNGGLATPLWYDEGFASFLSTARTEGRKVVVGEPSRYLLAVLREQVWPSSDEVLATTSLDDWGRRDRASFRARAWALVHFLHFGPPLDREPRARLDAALSRMASRDPARATTRDWFEVPADAFDRDLRRYVSSELGLERLVVRVDEDLIIDEPRALDCAAVGNALGRLALELERPVVARRYFSFAVACDGASAIAYSGLRAAASLRGRFQSAGQYRDRVRELAAEDPLIEIDAGNEFVAQAVAAEDPAERSRRLETARRHYQRSSELAPDSAAPLVLFARTFLGDLGDREDAARALEPLTRARTLLPSSMESLLALARAHADLGELGTTRELTDTIVSRADDPETRAAAQDLLDWTDRPERRPRP